MSIRNTDTKVFLYLNDYNAVCGEIYRHQHIETGGNLFGLWTTEGNVVVHVPLGPGENCKRTNVSFHQEIPYLSRVGSFLNKKFMLCHIGEWHSHHRLSLNEPSSGDKRTIRDNYPNGVKKFLVIIGNIVGRDQISLSPYFFSDNGNTCEKGKVNVLDTDSPFTIDETIFKEMNQGAETPRQPIENPSPVKADQVQATPTDRPGANDDSQQIAMDTCSNSNNSTPKSGSGSASEDKSPTYSIPPPDYERPTTPKSPSEPPTRTATPQNSTQPSASHDPAIANSSSGSEGDDGNKQTRKEVIMKKVFDEIKSRFEDSGIVIEGGMSDVIEMKFKHNNKHWFLKFPQSFPEKPAQMFSSSYSGKFSDAIEMSSSKCKFLNNYFDILLLIKKECNWNCSPCKRINVESLRQSDPTLDLFLTEEGNAMIKDLWDKAKETLTDTRNLEKKMKSDEAYNNAILEVSFTHSSKQWIIAVRSTFPAERSAAKLCYEDESRLFGGFRRFVYENGQDSSKDWVSKVLFAITNCCRCVDCKRL